MEARGVMQRYERMPMLAIGNEEYQNVVSVMSELPVGEFIS